LLGQPLAAEWQVVSRTSGMKLREEWWWSLVAFAIATSWPHGAHAQIGNGELVARLSFVFLIPLGVVQTLVAAKVSTSLSRSRTGLTAAFALLSSSAGLAAALSGGDAHTIRTILAILACLPGVPLSIGLVREKMWGVMLVAVVLPAAVGVFVILSGARS
jgi:hypothetical protein